MRLLCFIVLAIITLIEIGPIPITPLLLLWVVVFRPMWFYHLVIKIYAKKLPINP
jgi:hypothetical protein